MLYGDHALSLPRTVAVATNHPAERLAAAELVVASLASLEMSTLKALVVAPRASRTPGYVP